MAAPNARTQDDVRRDIEAEREQLSQAVDSLRASVSEMTNLAGKVRANLPIVAEGALGAEFVLAGGIGATMRLLMRRGREGTERARFGPFSLVERD